MTDLMPIEIKKALMENILMSNFSDINDCIHQINTIKNMRSILIIVHFSYIQFYLLASDILKSTDNSIGLSNQRATPGKSINSNANKHLSLVFRLPATY